MADFKRGMGPQLTEKLKKEDLFLSKLKPDMENGQVFFAIRPGYGSFYLKGRSLFSYKENGFSTHSKFAFLPSDKNKTYITQCDLEKMEAIKSFKNGYDRIKERAELYADTEATGVSALYKDAPTEKNIGKRYYLVDTEIVFEAMNDTENNDDSKRTGTDRIDILLYDNQDRQLLFCEAKHFSNSEIWAPPPKDPKVIRQLEKYDGQIAAHNGTIIEQYKTAFEEYNKLMGTELKEPTSVCAKCGLYIFGFNREQQSRLKDIFDANKDFHGRRCRIIGDTSNDSVEKVYKELTRPT